MEPQFTPSETCDNKEVPQAQTTQTGVQELVPTQPDMQQQIAVPRVVNPTMPETIPYQGMGASMYPIQPQGIINLETCQITQDDAESAAQSLYGALKGIKVDHDKIIEVLSSYNKVQLSAISFVYKKKYGCNLKTKIFKKSSKFYGIFASTLLNPPFYFEASVIKDYLEAGQKYSDILLVIAARTSDDLQRIIMAGMQPKYFKPWKEPKPKENIVQILRLAQPNATPVSNLCELLLTRKREVTPVDQARAISDAKDLIVATKGMRGDDKVFSNIFTSRSYPQIQEIVKQFEAQKGDDIKKVIHKKFIGIIPDIYILIIFMSKSPEHGQAYVLHRAMKYGVISATGVFNSIAHIYDNDMLEKVKAAFFEITGKDLVKRVARKCPLYYKKLCLELLNFKGKKHNVELNIGYGK